MICFIKREMFILTILFFFSNPLIRGHNKQTTHETTHTQPNQKKKLFHSNILLHK
jgi:hypothetical protein